MQALNAVRLTPISVLSERRTEPRKISQLKSPAYSSFGTNPPNLPEGVSRSFHGSLLLLSSALNPGLARALTYEEAIQLSGSQPSSVGGPDLDVLDGIVNFVVENPLVIAGVAAFIAVPLVVSLVLSKSKPWGVESARKAYEKLGDDPSVQLLDIRAPGEVRQVGSPDIRGLKKKPVAVVYRGENKPGFLKKLALRFQEPENTTLFILDKFDGNSELVAELVTANGFKAAYAIKDGAEGNRGWMNSGLPWILPKKTLSFDLSGLTDAVEGAIGEGPDALSVTLGVAAAAGLGILAFSEVETVLQLLGSAALIQVMSKKLLFAEQRKQTLQQVNEFLDTKIAPKELVGDIKQIGTALLPPTVTSKALPAPPEASPATPTVQKAEAMAEPPPQINSVPRTEVNSESLPGISRPLSPYPFYPDLKPPSSPSPSQP